METNRDWEEITLQGTVVEIIYENDDNGYKICDILCNGEMITVRGTLPFLFVGEPVTFTGHFENHKVYGDQFIVTGYTKQMPESCDDIEQFLASGLIDGVGPATAKAIVKKFGVDSLQVILHTPEKLSSIRGITPNRALRIRERIETYEQMRDMIVFFNKYGVSTGVAMKVYHQYGGLAVSIVEQNPYRLIDDIPEIGFKTADRIGLSIGIGADAVSRICAGLLHVLSMALGSGHVFLPEDQLIQETVLLLSVSETCVRESLDTLCNLHRIVCVEQAETRAVFLDYMYACETYIAARLCALANNTRTVQKSHFTKSMHQFETQTGLTLDENQLKAIRQSAEQGFSIITGGPGTGKTTIIKALVHLLTGEQLKCVLAAPTGRAAKRMTEACGLPAKTIHRLLEFYAVKQDQEASQEAHMVRDDYKLEFGKNEHNPLDVNVLIIDESSMLDTILLYHLLKAVPADSQVIFVGDQDQLPSVGPGNVLKDLIQTKIFPTTVLGVIYRQASQSMIAYNAHRINYGQLPELNVKERDFFLLPRRTADETMRTLLDVVCRRLPTTYGIDPMGDIQVLIPNKKGICGVANANTLLQQALNPAEPGKNEYTSGGSIFREGDRVMQVKNNYDILWRKQDQPGVEGKGVFNGEMGIIVSVDTRNKAIAILFDEDRLAVYDYPSMHQIEHCYAITVHKSQGSEFDYCVIPLMPGPPMLMTRNILYTAITRARKMVVLIGSGGCIETMVANNTEQKRYTHLADKILERSHEP